MKLGLVTDFYWPWIGGPAEVVRALARGLSARGHLVSVLAPSPTGRPFVELDGPIDVQRARTAPLPFGYNVRVAYRPYRDAHEWLGRVQPDVVHFHHPFPLSAAAARLAIRRDIPLVATNHTVPECSLWGIRNTGPLYRLAHAIFSWHLMNVLDRAAQVATPTETAAAMLHALGYRRSVATISNGVDTTRFSPGAEGGALRARLGLDSRPVVLYTGRLDAEKQMDVWLRAAALLSQRADVQFVVGGKGAEQEVLQRLASELDVRDRVHFIGYVSDRELPELYRLADVYFVTSPVELQSIATLEAAATGLPVVAVRAGAIPEIVLHGENGYLVPPGDAEGAADALYRIVEDTGLRQQFGRRSRQVSMNHDLLRSVETYQVWLEAALDRPQGDRHRERAPAPGH